MGHLGFDVQARRLLLRMALVSYGAVQRYGGPRYGSDDAIGPPGEGRPMQEQWAQRFDRVGDDPEAQARALAEAQADFDAHIRRPLVPDTVETLDELTARIVSDGWGITAGECSRAMRCTPTLVRRARLAGLRHPESGYPLPEPDADGLTWARRLDDAGLSVRQIEAVTGIPKSTLHDRLTRRAS